MEVPRGVEDGQPLQKEFKNTTTARALLRWMEKIARGDALDRKSSDETTAVLKPQTFNDRIPAGLPSGTPVAHKTGEITRIQHDAAIVYAERPFVLVVLVRGFDDAKKGSALAADIARTIYAASQGTQAGPKVRTTDPTAQLLAELIRVDTSNPPGRTAPLDELLVSK